MVKTTTRRMLTAVSMAYIVLVGFLSQVVPLPVFNPLLATVAAPLVWLIWAFSRWSAHQHADRWARDIEKVHGGQRREGAVR